MLNHGTRWSAPCGCSFLLAFDDTLAPQDRVQEWYATENICDKHIHLTQKHTRKANHAKVVEDKFKWIEDLLDSHHKDLVTKHRHRISVIDLHDEDSIIMLPDRVKAIAQAQIDNEVNAICIQLEQTKRDKLAEYAKALSKPYSQYNIWQQVAKEFQDK